MVFGFKCLLGNCATAFLTLIYPTDGEQRIIPVTSDYVPVELTVGSRIHRHHISLLRQFHEQFFQSLAHFLPHTDTTAFCPFLSFVKSSSGTPSVSKSKTRTCTPTGICWMSCITPPSSVIVMVDGFVSVSVRTYLRS